MMKRLLAWSSSLFLAIAIGLASFGLMAIVTGTVPDKVAPSRSDGGPAVIGAAISPATIDVNLGEIRPRFRTHFEVKLTNTGSVPVKIVGIPGFCTQVGCVEAVDPPATIPPHQDATISFKLTCQEKSAESFRMNTAIYFDVGDRSGLSVPIHVMGTVSDVDASPQPPPDPSAR
jgi:hypothetical protein